MFNDNEKIKTQYVENFNYIKSFIYNKKFKKQIKTEIFYFNLRNIFIINSFFSIFNDIIIFYKYDIQSLDIKFIY